jgi:hypothetical protein
MGRSDVTPSSYFSAWQEPHRFDGPAMDAILYAFDGLRYGLKMRVTVTSGYSIETRVFGRLSRDKLAKWLALKLDTAERLKRQYEVSVICWQESDDSDDFYDVDYEEIF